MPDQAGLLRRESRSDLSDRSAGDARELVLRWIHAICRAWPPQRYGTAGLTASSPHYGVGVGGIFRFP